MLRRHQQLAFAGSIHFVTTVTQIRGDWFIDEEICKVALQIFEDARAKSEVKCLGYVLMPDHLHIVLYQTDGEARIPEFMMSFKSRTAFKCWPAGYEGKGLWRRRYDDVPLPGPKAVLARLKYMHENPIRRRIVETASDYLWSSARAYDGIKDPIITLSKELICPGR
ncbi:transposase [bacterium]|nr:transposase [bacterium]